MRSSIRTSICLLALAIGSVAPKMAHAETVTATLTGLDPWTFGTLYLSGFGDGYGGIGNIQWQGSVNNDSPFNGAFNSYCIDLIEEIDFGNTYTFVVAPLQDAPKSSAYPGGGGPMGALKATELMELFGQQYTNTLGVGNGIDREAMQLAIWNIIYDTDTSVSTGAGSFYAEGDVDPNAIAIANAWLADAANPADQAIYQATDLEALIGCNGAQDQIVINPNIGISTSVPLPAPALGGGLLLAGLALTQVRKSRRALECM